MVAQPGGSQKHAAAQIEEVDLRAPGGDAVAAYALPFKLNIVVAIAAAVAMGLLIDHTTTRQIQPVDDRT